MGVLSQNVTIQAGFRLAMVNRDGPQQTAVDGVVADAEPACMALVPTVQPAQWSPPGPQPSRPNSMFVTHLIATAERAPQTRSLRRATAADARTAYQASQRPAPRAGFRTRQIV
jgi:hypothetical protein